MTLTLDNLQRNMRVRLAVPQARPIKTLDGALHEAGQTYRVLGLHGTLVRLSRVMDCAKLIINVEALTLEPEDADLVTLTIR